MRVLSCVLILVLAGCAQSTFGKALNVGVGGAAVADLITTTQGLQRGAVEANPLMRGSELRRWAIKSLGVGGVIGLAHLNEQKNRRIMAHLIRGMAIVVWSAIAYHNHGVYR